MSNVTLKTLVSKQVPEFVREDNPVFVAFLEAYYEFIDQNYSVDISSIRDLDKTLEEFILYIKKEVNVFGDDDYEFIDKILLLRKIKQVLVSKGSEAAYKFLFKILYDKPVTITYPWDSVLKASDGKWKQDTTMFIQVTKGNIVPLVGSRVSIISSNRTIFVYIQNVRKVSTDTIVSAPAMVINSRYRILTVGTTDFTIYGAPDNNVGTEFTLTSEASGSGTAVLVEDPIYEVFIDKSYYGIINIGDKLNYQGVEGNILPTTTGYTIEVPGKGYAIGDLIVGTTFANNRLITQRLKVTKVGFQGEIQGIKTINFGYGYSDDFFLYISGKKTVSSTTKIKITKDSVQQFEIPDGSVVDKYDDFGQIINPNYWVTYTRSITFTANGTNVNTADNTITYASHSFVTGDVVVYTNGGGTSIGGLTDGNTYHIIRINDNVIKLATSITNANAKVAIDITSTGSGTSHNLTAKPMSESSYAGTLLQQFFTETLTSEEISEDFALIKFNIGPIAKYQGYYASNDGFLSDNIYLQDSKYYQKYSYLVTIDERLQDYKTLLKSFIHPAGIALFGEYQIQNVFTASLNAEIEVTEYESKASIVVINKQLNDLFTVSDSGGRINVNGYDSQTYFADDFNVGTFATTITG